MNKWYWICLNEWLFNKEIRNELGLLIYISSLTASSWECWATNDHFAEKFKESTVSVSRKLNKLIKLGFIEATYIREWAKVKKRTIRLSKLLTHGYQNWQNTVNKIVKENSIKNNNINNNISIDDVNEVYEYYIRRIKLIGVYNNKYNKKALSLERIAKTKKDKEFLFSLIDNYIKTNREQIRWGYAKMCQYFFWPVEKGSKVMFYADYIPEEKKQKQIVEIEDLVFN